MAETLAERQKLQRILEDIHNSLIAVSQKVAGLELDLGEGSDLSAQLDEVVAGLGPLIDRVTALESDYRMETNRLQNEDELA